MPKRPILTDDPVRTALGEALVAVSNEPVPASLADLARALQDAIADRAEAAGPRASHATIPDDQGELRA